MGAADRDAERRLRADARRRVATIRGASLDASDGGPEGAISGAEAISLVTTLTRAAWSLAGRPFPSYARKDTPYVFVPRETPES